MTTALILYLASGVISLTFETCRLLLHQPPAFVAPLTPAEAFLVGAHAALK